MNKITSHFLAFLGGALLVGASAWFVVYKASEVLIFETFLTNQKLYLTTMKLLRSNEVGKVLEMMELNACVYYQLLPQQKYPQTEEQTKKYFLEYYPQGNSPCNKVPDLMGKQ